MGAVGTSTVNFGTAVARTLDVSVVVTGQASILSGSVAEAFLMASTTSDHSADEHVMASSMLDLTCGDVVAGTGFTIYATARDEIARAGLVGQFTIQ